MLTLKNCNLEYERSILNALIINDAAFELILYQSQKLDALILEVITSHTLNN